MTKKNSQAILLKKRVRQIQNRAKWAGILYLLGTIALAALLVVICSSVGTWNYYEEATIGWLAFYAPIINLFAGGVEAWANITGEQIVGIISAVLLTVVVLVAVINVFRSLAKLGWLFKRRASYTNGFNRNAYAMDDMAKYFSDSFGVFAIAMPVWVVLGGVLAASITEPAGMLKILGIAMYAVGLFVHFFAGLIGGKVTLFTTGDRIEEEPRPNGLLVYFVRNVIQLAATTAIVYFLLKESVLLAKLTETLDILVAQKVFADIDYVSLIPAGLELLAWLFIAVLIKHGTSATEFNREGMYGTGMRNFAIFALLTALVLVAEVVLPMTGLLGEATTVLNQNLTIAAAVAAVAFLLEIVIRGKDRGDHDDLDADSYFANDEYPYNNTII